MGEGEGLKDVSDQIENEEQLLGTKQPPSSSKDDDPQTKNKNEKKEKPLSKEEADKGVEMMQDFEGDMMDLEQDNEDDNNSNDDEEEENPEEPDKEMGILLVFFIFCDSSY
jgi:midasin